MRFSFKTDVAMKGVKIFYVSKNVLGFKHVFKKKKTHISVKYICEKLENKSG